MKIMTIQVPDDSVEFVEEFVERIGGNVEVKEDENKPVKKAKTSLKKKDKATKEKLAKKKEKIDHTYLFGKWKDFDIDAKKIRQELWRK